MTLCYDIDISYLYPPEVFDDPAKGALLRRNGLQPHSRANYVAKFRDPHTAQALSEASDGVKAYFQDCGFALVPSGVSLPSGTYEYMFGNHLKDVAERMHENLAVYDLSGQHWNGLDISACEKAIHHAKPIEPVLARAVRTIRNAKKSPYWTHLLRPTLALPVLALGLFLTLQLLAGAQGTVVSTGLIDASVTRLLPAGQ
ncbi:MAG: hypothetical protein WA782_08820 [Sulfitobacter sp.]